MQNLSYLRASGVYRIRNTVNGSCYIGSSVNMYTRRSTHLQFLKTGKHHNSHLRNACNKYGVDAFVFEMIEYCEIDLLIQREQHYLDTAECELYNIRIIADSCRGRKLSPEHIEKIRMRSIGKKWSKEQRENFVSLMTGRVRTPEHAAKLVAARIGTRWTDAQRAAISAKRKGRRFTNDASVLKTAKPYPSFVSPDGTIYPPGVNICIFCREHGLNNSHMRRVGKGLLKHSKGWMLLSGYEEKQSAPPSEPKLPKPKPPNIYGKRIRNPESKSLRDWPDLVNPDGVVISPGRNLEDFCRNHGLCSEQLRRVIRGERNRKHHKGWRVNV